MSVPVPRQRPPPTRVRQHPKVTCSQDCSDCERLWDEGGDTGRAVSFAPEQRLEGWRVAGSHGVRHGAGQGGGTGEGKEGEQEWGKGQVHYRV